MTTTYNAEQGHHHLAEKLEDHCAAINESLSRIEDQTRLTNGRVTRLERWQIAVMTAICVLSMAKWPELLKVFGFMVSP